jgi:hypothetical protein
LRGHHLAIHHHRVGQAARVAEFERIEHAGIGRGLFAFQQAGLRQGHRRGADGRGVAAGGGHAFQQGLDAGIVAQMLGAGQAAGQRDEVEVAIKHVIQIGIRFDADAATALDDATLQAGNHHLNPGAAQQIGQGDGFQVFEAWRQRNQYACHVFSFTTSAVGQFPAPRVRRNRRWPGR